ncbi:MAG: hypothetical protein EBV42_00765 [Actinobacteria bacterium]|nr:hypothetical protein [Actinomycetota bacterium]
MTPCNGATDVHGAMSRQDHRINTRTFTRPQNCAEVARVGDTINCDEKEFVASPGGSQRPCRSPSGTAGGGGWCCF